MIYEASKGLLLFLLQAPAGPPAPPAGSPGSVRIFRASRQYLLYRLVGLALVFLIFTMVSALFALFFLFNSMVGGGVRLASAVPTGLVLLMGLIAYFTTRLEYDMRYYLVTDRSLRIREGVWKIQEVTLTYANVQHLEIHQGPIQQLLGISDLVVHTAGGGVGVRTPQQAGSGHQGMLKGIDNAEEIRDLINGHLRHYRHAGLGDPEERRAHAQHAQAPSPAIIERLKEIRDELRAWRQGSSFQFTRK